MMPATMVEVPMPIIPVDEDGVMVRVGDAVGYFVGDEVGGTVKVSKIELIVPTRALFRSKVSVPSNPVKHVL